MENITLNKNGKIRKNNVKICQNCGDNFVAYTKLAKFCSSSCKQQNYLDRKTQNYELDIKNDLEALFLLQNDRGIFESGVQENVVDWCKKIYQDRNLAISNQKQIYSDDLKAWITEFLHKFFAKHTETLRKQIIEKLKNEKFT